MNPAPSYCNRKLLASIVVLGVLTVGGSVSAQVPTDSSLNLPILAQPLALQLDRRSASEGAGFELTQFGALQIRDKTGSQEAEVVEAIHHYLAMQQSDRMEPALADKNTTSDAKAETDADDEADDQEMQPSSSRSRRQSRSPFDQSRVNRGRQLFQSSCTQCHDAERSLSKRKSYAGWLATVRRMAAKEDADIPTNEHVPIATYLASLNPANRTSNGGENNEDDQGGGAADAMAQAEALAPPFTLNGTLSPVWRGTDTAVENKGFFPDVWVGLEWRPPESPVSGRVITCTSCHGANQGLGVELVEASVTLDLIEWLNRCPDSKRCPGSLEAELKAGRFIVPFGAFSGRVHPGALRTVSPPLMYNMGRRVGPVGIHQPVLNMPYSDEGFNLHIRHDLPNCRDWSATFDLYGVNGLQTGGPGVFFDSRSYRDNNSNVAVGGRATIGNRHLKIGGSVASGEQQFEFPGAALQNYKLAGGDVSFRWNETVRAYYEYAIRDEDPFPGGRNLSYGHLVEAEITLLSDPKISLLTRYDTLENHGNFGDQMIERFTWGFNFALYGGSTLILNHEHWSFDSRSSIDILGIRWTMAF